MNIYRLKTISRFALVLIAMVLYAGVKTADTLHPSVLYVGFCAALAISAAMIVVFALSRIRFKRMIEEIEKRADIKHVISVDLVLHTVIHVIFLAMYGWIVAAYLHLLI